MEDDAPHGFMEKVGHTMRTVAREEVARHERRKHALPPPNRAPLTAIPFADVKLADPEITRAVELLTNKRDPMTIEEVAYILECPVIVLERHLAEFRPRWRKLMFERSQG